MAPRKPTVTVEEARTEGRQIAYTEPPANPELAGRHAPAEAVAPHPELDLDGTSEAPAS